LRSIDFLQQQPTDQPMSLRIQEETVPNLGPNRGLNEMLTPFFNPDSGIVPEQASTTLWQIFSSSSFADSC
jgi:hypothetical protein